MSWLSEHQHLRSLEEVKRNLRWLTDRLQGKPLASITPDVIRRLTSERKAQLVNGKPSSAGTVNRHLSDLSEREHSRHGTPNDNGPSPKDEGPLQGLCPVLPGVADGTQIGDVSS